jgi:hypothetical protein
MLECILTGLCHCSGSLSLAYHCGDLSLVRPICVGHVVGKVIVGTHVVDKVILGPLVVDKVILGPGHRVACVNKFYTVVPNICESTVWNLLHVTLLTYRILR